MRRQALSAGVTQVLRLAAGQSAALAEATDVTGWASDALVDASRFFVEQQLLARELEGDPWRVLGVSPGADTELVREHRRLLMALVHPDRGEDWATAYADRVNRAWRQLKTEEGRARALEDLGQGGPDKAVDRPHAPNVDTWGSSGSHGAQAGDRETRWTNDDTERPFDSASRLPPPAFAIVRAGTSDIQSPPGRLPALAASAAALGVLGVLAWGVMEREWRGEEVLISTTGGDLPGGLAAVSPDDAKSAPATPTPAPQIDSPIAPETSPARIREAAEPLAATPSLAQTPGAAPPRQADGFVVSPDAERDMAATTAVGARVPPVAPVGREIAAPEPRPRQLAAENTQVPVSAHRAAPVEAEPPPQEATEAQPPAVAVVPVPTSTLPAPHTMPSRADVQSGQPPVVQQESARVQEPAPASADIAIASPVPARATARESGPAASPMVVTQSEGGGGDAATNVLSEISARAALDAFSLHYANGDLSGLIGLFSSRANSARGGTMALAADYARLFEGTSQREIAVRDIRWRRDGDSLRGEGRFDARYYAKGKLFRQVVKGQISMVMVEEGGALRILRLDSRADGRGS